MKAFQQQQYGRIFGVFSLLILSSWLSAGSVLALEDALVAPAMKTDKARTSMLMDVTRAGDRYLTVGERGHVLYSEDAGESWIQAEVPARTNLTAVHFPTPEEGWAVGHDAVVLHSADGGRTWKKQLDGFEVARIALESVRANVDELERKLEVADPDIQEELTLELEELGWKLEDAEREVEIGPSRPFMDVWFRDEYEGFVLGAYGYFFRTTDGGENWEDYSGELDNPDSVHLYAINAVADSLFMVGEMGIVFRSTDQGKSWESMPSPYAGGLFGVLEIGTRGQVLIYGLRGNAFISSDQGETWSKVVTATVAGINGAESLHDTSFMLVGQGGTTLLCDSIKNSCSKIAQGSRTTFSAVVKAQNNRVIITGQGGVTAISQ